MRIKSSSLNVIHELGGNRIQDRVQLVNLEEKIEVHRIGKPLL